MEIILNTDIPKLGYSGDVVTVKPGYARNFLIPKGMAVVANASNRKMRAEMMKQQANKLAKRRDDAQTLANRLEATELTLKVKTGTTSKIFGSVTTLQVAHLLKQEGFDIDRRNISFEDPIKEVGTYKAQVECYKGIVAQVTVNVKPEKGE
ncbi:MAG: 50S ribosomal protein L9 [Bacteroidia bacterium]